MAQGNFFAIDSQKWLELVQHQNMAMAASYLVLATGSQKDNSTTKWSVNAIEKYTTISRFKAKKAIQNLIDNNFIKLGKGSKKYPLYKINLTQKPELIWLPNEITIGTTTGEMPPLERIKRTFNIDLLSLFIELYQEHYLLDSGGIDRKIIYSEYQAEKISKLGKYNIWRFDSQCQMLASKANFEGRYAKKKDGKMLFFTLFEKLNEMMLVEEMPMLFENADEDAEYLHELTNELDTAALFAAEKMLGDFNRYDDSDFLIPLKNELTPEIFGIYRMVYRPKTKQTSMWWANKKQTENEYLKIYQGLKKGNQNQNSDYREVANA